MLNPKMEGEEKHEEVECFHYCAGRNDGSRNFCGEHHRFGGQQH